MTAAEEKPAFRLEWIAKSACPPDVRATKAAEYRVLHSDEMFGFVSRDALGGARGLWGSYQWQGSAETLSEAAEQLLAAIAGQESDRVAAPTNGKEPTG